MTRVAYLDCVGGLAGDMLLGALLDAGAPAERLDEVVRGLAIPGVRVEIERVRRHGVGATSVRVVTEDEQTQRRAPALRDIVERTLLPEAARGRALEALDRLATVEAGIHHAPVDEVFLHELGGHDTLVDLCGAFALIDALGVDRVVCSPLPFGHGVVSGAHGLLPVPAPATLALLEGVPFRGIEQEGEWVTPTGAAIVAVGADEFGPLPPLTLTGVGYGAGTRDTPDRPNVLRVVLGEAADTREDRPPILMLEATIDDLVPELVPDALARATEAGAVDAWVAPVQMKKGRPGIVISVLARPEDEDRIAAVLLEHTSTLGVRVSAMHRHELAREVREVTVHDRPVRMKVGLLHGRVVNVAPEHDDCAAVAAVTGRTVKEIWAAALAESASMREDRP